MKVIYVKTCMERVPRFRQQTLILQEGDTRLVRKTAASPEAMDHIQSYVRNRELLCDALHPGCRIQVLPCTGNPDGSVDFPFCSEPSLRDLLHALPPEKYSSRVAAFQTALTEAFGAIPFYAGKTFCNYFGDFPVLSQTEGLFSLKLTNLDLNFDNIFCSFPEGKGSIRDGTESLLTDQMVYTMIDYEWIMSFPIPLSFVFYRALLLDPTFRSFSEEDRRKVKDALEIRADLEDTFARMEERFMASVSPEETRLDYFITHSTPVTRVNHRLDLMLNLVARDRSLLNRLHQKKDNLFRMIQKHLT